MGHFSMPRVPFYAPVSSWGAGGDSAFSNPPIRWPTGYYGQARCRFFEPHPCLGAHEGAQCRARGYSSLCSCLVGDASSACSRRHQKIVRRTVTFVPPGLHSSQRPSTESEWPTPATELQHSWLFVLRTWGCTEPTFLPFGCTTSAVCEGEEWRLMGS
jgi:hypothetical protein